MNAPQSLALEWESRKLGGSPSPLSFEESTSVGEMFVMHIFRKVPTEKDPSDWGLREVG